MKHFVTNSLAGFATRVIRRHKPFVIAITGSVGKSSAKQAIDAVLRDTFHVRTSPKNFNTDIGVPLTILDLPNGGRSPIVWLSNLVSGWSQAAFGMKHYPDTLVLEMGADRPGDIARLARIAPPDIAVVTAVGEAHLEFFGSVAGEGGVQKEKRALVEALDADGIAVLNADDALVLAMRSASKGRVMTYGFSVDADVRATDAAMQVDIRERAECGMRFAISHAGVSARAFMPGVLGMPAVSAALAAAAVGLAKNLPLSEIAARLHDVEAPPGRMRALTGIKRTLLIDDTYNASPKAAFAALETLNHVPLAASDDKKIAVLGDMLELGASAQQLHEQVGRAVVDAGVDLFVAVGELMGDAAKAAVAYGMPAERVAHFGSTEDAGRFVQERLKQGDAVLVKGSQSMRMERVVKELMADPLHARQLLCRQDESWDA